MVSNWSDLLRHSATKQLALHTLLLLGCENSLCKMQRECSLYLLLISWNARVTPKRPSISVWLMVGGGLWMREGSQIWKGVI